MFVDRKRPATQARPFFAQCFGRHGFLVHRMPPLKFYSGTLAKLQFIA